MSLNPKLDEQLGLICYETENLVIRSKQEGDELHVFVHQKACGRECLPRGYMLGSNCLIYKHKT